MNEEDFQSEEDKNIMLIYSWVDSVNLSRPKKNITRDFCDGVLLAEMIKSVYPQLVELHNYPNASSTKQKEQNWGTLNRKVLSRMGLKLTQTEISDVINCKPFTIEQVLAKVYNQIYGGEEGQNKKIVSVSDFKNMNYVENKQASKEEIIKKHIADKEKRINELRNVLELLQFKLKNSEDENKKIEDKIQQYQLKLMNKK